MRVGIVSLIQESNTFLAERTTLRRFEQDVLLCGESIRARFADAHHEIGGFFQGLAAEGIQAVPLFAARALPYGVMTDETFAHLLGLMWRELERAGPLDGILAAPHGATASESEPDADGYWLTELRRRVGPSVPLIATADPHANLSQQMIDATSALIAYRTNPHMDQRERGIEAATLMARTLRGEVVPTQAAAFPPMAINIECQHTSQPPCRPFYQAMDGMLSRPRVLSNSLVLGFPYGDVPKMGSAVIVVTDNDPALARELAGELAAELWSRRKEFVPKLIGVDAALDRAAGLDGPVCLLDMGDNVGGGSPGDGTDLARGIHARRMNGFVCLADAESVAAAEVAGVGKAVHLRAGGKAPDAPCAPLEAQFTVLGLYDGKFSEPQPRHGGFSAFDQGRTAVVREPGGLTVMLTSRRMAPFSLRQLTSFGVDPASFQVIVAKGVHAPVAAYDAVCRHFIRVDTPGVTTADMTRLRYRNRRRPLFPFEPDAAWQPAPRAKPQTVRKA